MATVCKNDSPRPIPLNWKTDAPVWVEQWPLTKEKLEGIQQLVEEQLRKKSLLALETPQSFRLKRSQVNGDF